jgi:hypothetical protein
MRRHPLTEADIDLDRLLDEAQSEPIGIERRGRVRAVLVGLARYEGSRARRVELESELRQAREMLEKRDWEVEGLRVDVEDLRGDRDHWRALAEKLRHFVPKGADAFLLDEDDDPKDAEPEPEPEPEPGSDEPLAPLPLDEYRLSTAEGRRGFLIALRDHHGAAGLLMAVTHLWESLGRPKAHYAARIAASVGVGGRGKTALRRALERFIQESVVDRPRFVPPDREAFADDAAWFAETWQRQLQQTRRDAAIVRRWEAILSGYPPDEDEEPRGPAQIVKGPWGRTIRTKPGAKGEPPKPGS